MMFRQLVLLSCLVVWTSWSHLSLRSEYSATGNSDVGVYTPNPTKLYPICKCNFVPRTKEANCRNRSLNKLPNCIHHDTKRLILGHNNLNASSLSKAFEKFHHLKVLDISYCAIRSLKNDTFRGLGNLRLLDLSGNKLPLSPHTYKAVFLPVPKLKALYLGGNIEKDTHIPGLDYPDQALSHLSHLEWLGVDGLRNRSFGPGFSKLTKLRGLDVSGVNGTCHLEALRNSTFQHLKGVTHLSLKECRINYTETGTFLPLRHLHTLILSSNRNLTFERFTNASVGLKGSNLTVLNLNRIDTQCVFCKTLCPAYLQHLRSLPLKELHLDGNRLRHIAMNVTSFIPPSLKRLTVRDNDIYVESNLLFILELSNITELDAGCKDPRLFSRSSDRSYSSDVPCLPERQCPPMTLEPAQTISQRESDEPWKPTNIEVVDLSWQRTLSNIYANAFSAPKLRYLDITGMIIPHWVGPVTGIENLTVLNLSCNFAQSMSDSFFNSTTNIEVLNISWNSFKSLFEIPAKQSIFFPLKKLRVVDLSFNQLTRFPNQTTELFGSVEELYLAGNKLVPQWFDVDFSLFRRLRILDVSQNSLSTLNRDVCHSLDTLAQKHKVEIRFQFNPIQCSCENAGFLSWLLETKVHLPGKDEDYLCMLQNGSFERYNSSKEWLDRLHKRCHKNVALPLGCLGSTVLTITLVLCGVIYRFRWHFRYFYYSTRNRLAQTEARDERDRFQFDAFVSYANEDESFVRNELMPRLEGQEGLRLCIHSRDFHPGRTVISNTVEAVQRSRRTLCLVSRNFLDSYWCTYEMQMAKMESLHTGRDVVVMVLYEQIRACSLPKEVLFYIRSESYVEFPRDPRCEQYFWDNLVRALK